MSMRREILGGAGLLVTTIALTFISWTASPEKAASAGIDTSGTTLNVQTAGKDTVSGNLMETETSRYQTYLKRVYDLAHLAEAGLSLPVFEKAVTGFYNLKNSGKLSKDKSVLTIADFDMSSTKKRLWIVDLDKGSLLLNTWVAHGQGSGNDKANAFSNRSNSHQSSLGFYVTGEIYRGQHGRSLRLDGMDAGFNSNARSRAIVVHGADYVSQGTINALGRLGRSHGCPAVAPELTNKVIDAIEGKTVLFINSSEQNYQSKYLDTQAAALFASAQNLSSEVSAASLD